MLCTGTPKLMLLMLCTGILIPADLTVGYPLAAAPTSWQEPPELPSGVEPIETTPLVHIVTGPPPDASEAYPTYEDPLDNSDGSLGPGAATAIVLAVLLGTSVLIALIVITFRKCSAS